MSGGGWDAPPPANGGEFLLSLLQRPQRQRNTPQPPQQMPPLLSMDPAVAAVGPSASYFPTSPSPWADIPAAATNSHIWANNPPSAMPWSFPINNSNNNDNSQQRWFSGIDNGGNTGYGTIGQNRVHNYNHKQEPSQQQKLDFGSPNGNFLLNQAAKEHQFGRLNNNFDGNHQFVKANHEHDNMRGKQQQHYIGNRHTMPSSETRMLLRQPPPGFSRQIEEDNYNRGMRLYNEDVNLQQRLDPSIKLDNPPLPMKSTLQTTSRHDTEESLLHSHLGEEDDGDGDNVDNLGRQIVESLLEAEADGNKDKKNHRDKEVRSDNRGQQLLSHGMRVRNSKRPYRRDIFRLNAPLLAIYESLIPSEEEKTKQSRLFTRLEKLVTQEWPEAQLYLYGSCASSFGVLKSDIDVCLSFRGQDINKSEVLLKLADILQSDNLQNVQALTRARVPIVKLMDPETGISCDICINNLLAVINTKLLRDYAQIDGRLRQLAFIVKHWAKTRGVNETYQGTLSSYAYVLMCIHFLQQRRPAILPSLQMMEPTFAEIVDDIRCAFYDRVERLSNYGSQNMESIAELVWGFFTYWAYRHDYTRDVISVRTGGIISKRDKDWTRRIGNDRHLICIEDPFEITHDLGRVVDKFSIKVLREEFERAAEILQFDPNPCVTLFEPYVPTC